MLVVKVYSLHEQLRTGSPHCMLVELTDSSEWRTGNNVLTYKRVGGARISS